MDHGNIPYEPTLKCRYTWTFELEPVLLGIELGHWGYEMGTSWAQVMLCSWNCIKSKVRKVPRLWGLAQTPEIWGNFMMNEHLLISICMYCIRNHSQSIQHDELHRKTPCSLHMNHMRTFDLKIPKWNLFLRKFPLSLEFQVPSFLSSHMSQCSSLSSFSSTTRWDSMYACIPMSIQLAI